MAAITAYANPAYVWSDSGWYLSFLAFFGIIAVAPLVHHWAPNRFSDSLLGGMILESICAVVLTTPYVLHIFGQTSLVALWAYILVASFVPVVMLFTMIAGIAGTWLPLVAGWFTWPTNLVLNYILDACALLSKIPHVFIENMYLGTLGMVLWYAALGVFCFIIKRRKDAIITERI